MAELVVVSFDTPDATEKFVAEINALQKQYVVKLQDAAFVSRSADGKYQVKEATDLVGNGLLGGAFWGLLVGTLFLMPFVGAAIGAATGGITGKLADIGIDKHFIDALDGKLAPGKSAVVLIIEKATPDRVLEAVKGLGGTVIQSSLSAEDQAKLQEALGAAPAAPAAS